MEITALVAIADGVEEIEASTIVDVLRRANVSTTVASIGASELPTTGSRGLVLQGDCLLAHCVEQEWDLIALPGGAGAAERFGECEMLIQRIAQQRDGGQLFAAICASPALALAPHGLLEGYRATCYPAFANRLGDSWSDQRVVVDGNCVTSQGPGTAMEFALALVTQLVDADCADRLGQQMLVQA